MLTRVDLKALAKARLADAVILHANRRYDGAVYICGYTVEAALKARICATLSWQGYPETRNEFQAYGSFRTHDLEALLHLSGVETKVKSRLLPEWSVVTTWTPEIRYRRVGQATQAAAEAMINSCRALFKAI